MSEFEVTWSSVKRKSNGEEFRLNLIPPELSDDQCIYIHPLLSKRIGFAARWVYDNAARGHAGGNIVERRVCLGIVLAEGQLRQRIETVATPLVKTDIDSIMFDCYDLIIKFIQAGNERQGFPEVESHIYKVPRREFYALTSTVELSQEVLSGARAILVF
jgi:hypothetical protein